MTDIRSSHVPRYNPRFSDPYPDPWEQDRFDEAALEAHYDRVARRNNARRKREAQAQETAARGLLEHFEYALDVVARPSNVAEVVDLMRKMEKERHDDDAQG